MADVEREQLVDPVCGMRMNPEESPAVTTYNNRSYYFCSDTHKEEFLRDPEYWASVARREEGEEAA